MFGLILFHSSILPLVLSIEWELVVDDLNTANFGTGSWQFRDQCLNGGSPNTVTGYVGTCTTNTNNYLQMQDNIMRVRQTFTNDIPHYEIRVVTDFYLIEVTGTLMTEVYVENNLEFQFSYTTTSLLDYRPICFTAGGNSDFQIRTYTVDASHQSNQNIKVEFCTSINTAGLFVGVRNLQIYIHRCYYTCSQCSGPNSNNCTNCYYGSNASTCQPCSTSTTGSRFIDYTVNLNCQMECNRNGKLADSNYVCQDEPRISQQETYFTGSFTSYSNPPWKFIADQLAFDSTSKVSTCSSTKFMGFFRFNEAMEFSFTLIDQVQYIRLRVTFYLSTDWQDDTSIQVLMDEIPMVLVKYISGTIQLTNAIQISTGTCGGYTTYRIEAIILKTSNSPKMKLKGNMDVYTAQSWGFSDFYVDVAVCQTNCSVCKNSEECYTCVATHHVYKGTCVQTCPPYSNSSTNAQGNICIDFDEETAQSQYLVKAFYDTTTTDDEVMALVGTVTTTGSPNFQTNSAYYWSYIPGKRVLGGSLVWFRAKFDKSFSIPNPHYSVHVRMSLILGDGMTGNFYYSFPTLNNITVTASNQGTTSNLWGKAVNEKIIPLDFTVLQSESTFSVTLHCQSVATFIYDGFCAVSDYFIVVHYCAPYCNACTGPNPGDCTSIQTLPANMLTFNPLKCNDNYFLDKSLLPNICTQCAMGCQECTSKTICTICKTTFYMIANTCYCNQGLYLTGASCSNCNSICQNCYAANANQCLSCYPQHYRYLSKNVCLCNPYYQDDGINLKCQPICGDMIIVEGEVCDDGNDVPFDGCHKCQYSCQLECRICILGHCLKCKSHWQLNQQTKKCQPICGDLQMVGNEECDDGNITPYDGCYQCKYQCDPRCKSCIYGKCQSCDSTSGWNLNQSLSICESQCSDLIVAITEQCEDGNITPFDGCFVCTYSCPLECSICTLGQCQQCISGYTYDNLLHTCFMTCGDGLKLPNEVCDDGNQTPYDGCYNCQYSCQLECTNCVEGICNACDTLGWELNNNNKCFPICGDGIQILVIEQCDDGNSTPFDGCYQCRESCQTECLNCYQGLCRMCIPTFQLNTQDYQCYPKCGDMLAVSYEECDDGNYIDFDGCSNCKNQCELTCTECVRGICEQCNTIGYYLSSESKCESICGDTIITNNEECDDGNNEQFDGCFQCKWQCQYECLNCDRGICEKCKDGYYLEGGICQSICGDSLISKGEQCDDGNYLQFDGCFNCKFEYQPECSQNCIVCDNVSHCLQCDVGYKLNYFTSYCSPICGDLIITQNEEWDVDFRDKGHYSQFQCQDGCQHHCSKGECLKCKDGWVLNKVDFTCSTICGDGEVGGLEFCDDANDIPFDGCFECLYQCQSECLLCENGKCQLCDSTHNLILSTQDCQIFQSCDWTIGMYLNEFNNSCNSHCGDLIIAFDEECDDGNFVPHDGCDNCLFSCDPLCSDCSLGVCIQCQSGYKVINQKCEGVCGDGILLAGLEECDDSNSIPRDGCTNCKIELNHGCTLTEGSLSICYTCPKNCQICDQFECKQCQPSYFMSQGLCVRCSDKCEECEGTPNNCISCLFEGCNLCESTAGSYSNLVEKSCYSKCGDNVVNEREQCDDGNNISNDGCSSQCQLEENFQCGDFGCEEISLPKISIKYVNSITTNNLLFLIENPFTAGYCEKITVEIELFSKLDFNISVTEKIWSNSCQFVFSFYKTIEKENLIHFFVPPIDEQRRQLSENTRELIIKPRKQVYYTESQISQAQSVLEAYDYLNLILKLIGPLTILLGGFNFFWTILDIFSWINNFYFLNVEYPENVRVFFQHLEWGDLFMIPSINIMNSEEDDYYFEAPPKFVEKDVDPLFLNNIQLFVYLIGLSFVVYFLAGRVLILINKLYKFQNKSKNLSFYNVQNNFISIRRVRLFNQQKIPILIIKLKQECQGYANNYRAILMQIMGLVFLDLCLASFLQITNTSTQEHWIVKGNIIISWLNLILIGYIFYLNYKVSNSHELLLKNKTFICIFGTLYEGIKIESSISRTYAFVNLIRKCLFIFFTVHYYDNPLLQTSTCCLACFLNIALLCYQNPFESVQLLIQNGLPDFSIFSIILTTVCLAVDEQSKLLNEEQKLTIGWVILSFIAISILTQLFFLMQVFYQNFQDRLTMVKDLICPGKTK